MSGVVEGLTREDIRQRIGDNLPNFFLGTTTSAPGDATSVIDTSAYGGLDVWNGHWIRFYSGTGVDGATRRVSDFDGAGDHTVSPAFGANVPSGANYERWHPDYHPEQIDRYINRAISDVIGRYYTRQQSFALHGDGKTTRFDMPADFDMVDKVEYRTRFEQVDVHDCESTFDETTDADFTQSNDDQDRKRGQSLKLEVAAGASAGDFVTASIASKDLSGMTHLEGWIKSTTALAAADWVIRLDDGVVQGDGTDLEVLSMQAVAADIWTFFRLALANPESDAAIVSIGLEMNVDKGAHTVWFDDLKAVNNDTMEWEELPDHLWRVAPIGQDLVLVRGGEAVVGYRLLRVSGGSNPEQMDDDADVATVPEDFLVARATALALLSGSRASREDPDGRRSLADRWERIAARAWAQFPTLVNVRKIR